MFIAMDGLLNGLHDFTVAYLDDIVIHSNTWENHLNHIEIVFDKLREAELKVKERKCTFGSGSCIYLGHVVGNGLVQPMECKVEAVKTFKQPKTKKDVRSFLGHCGYYRKFIPNFSSIATPLSDLTMKSMSKQVKWNKKCDKAFIELKEDHLCTNISHARFGPNHLFYRQMHQHLDWVMSLVREMEQGKSIRLLSPKKKNYRVKEITQP